MANTYVRYPPVSGGGGVTSVNGQTGVVNLDAADIPYDNTASGLTATEVQAAIDEIVASPVAPTGTPNTSAYFDAAGDLTSNSGSLYDETTFSRTDVLADTGGTFSAAGNGAYTHGVSQTSGFLLAAGDGALTSGVVTTGGIMNAGGDGSTASGLASGGGILSAAGNGSQTHGVITGSGSFLAADGIGSHVSGYVDGSGVVLTASGHGSKAFGYGTGFNIAVSGNGSMAGGLSAAAATDVSGNGALAFGDAHTVTSHLSQTLGLGNLNSSYASMAIGRYADDVGTAGSWVATDPLFVAGNGTGVGSEANAFQIDKDGRVTQTGALKTTAIRIVTTSATISARSDLKIVMNDIAAGVNTLTLPPGEDGLTYSLQGASTNTGTWALVPDGADTIDPKLPPDVSVEQYAILITFISGTWYPV